MVFWFYYKIKLRKLSLLPPPSPTLCNQIISVSIMSKKKPAMSLSLQQ